MNKIANYLNANLDGEAVVRDNVLTAFSQDKSILSIKPTTVVFPRTSDDIRKLASLSFQLAQKNKLLPVVACGFQNDFTGGSLTDGILINTGKHLTRIIDFDPDQALVHVQSGISLATINLLAKEHGLCLPIESTETKHSIGGIISNNLTYPTSSSPYLIYEMIDQLEVVLSDGTTLQTKRLNKRELSQKIGLSSAEGEIYRKIDALIEDNQALISSINPDIMDNAGYSSIARVKTNASFDLTPLIIGSQGTLGIITEAILRLDSRPAFSVNKLLSFSNLADAMDASDQIIKLKPTVANIFSHGIFELAKKQGKNYPEIQAATDKLSESTAYHLFVKINAKTRFSAKTIDKKLNSIAIKCRGYASQNDVSSCYQELTEMLDFDNSIETSAAIACGASIPRVKWQSFVDTIAKLETALGIALPLYGSILTEVINLQSSLDLKSIINKQKSLKLLNAYATLVKDLGGVICASGGEGQIKNLVSVKQISPELAELYAKIKQIFDPQNILAPAIKQPAQIRSITSKITSNYQNDYFLK